MADVIFFKTLLSFLLCLTRTSLNPNLIFSQNPPISSTNLYKISSKVCFLTFFSAFHFRLCVICFRVLELGIFEKRVGNYDFGQIFFKILIGLCPIWLYCICVSPLWQFELVFRHIFICSCIAHMCSVVLHSMCLTKCSSGIFELFWTQMSSNFWVYPWLNLFNMFWSLGVCFTHFAQLCLTMPCHASPRHASCTPHAH